MDVQSDTFDALKALFDADTGSGGLRETGGGTAYTHAFLDEDDDPDDTPGEPYIVCRVIPPNTDTYGHESVKMLIRMSVVTLRSEQPSVSQNPILSRMRTTFGAKGSYVTPSTRNGWKFGPLVRQRGAFRGPSNEGFRHRIVEYTLIASRSN